MKRIAGILSFVFLLSLVSNAKNEILFRVQVGAYKKEEAPKDIRKIPKLKKYVLPEGYYCFFAGGYYSFFEGANRCLANVKEMGYSLARIRVIRDGRLLSDESAEKYVLKEMVNPTPIPANKKVDQQKYSIDQKRTLENRMILFKEITQPKEINDDSLNLTINKPKLDLRLKLKGFSWKRDKKSGKKNSKEDEDSEKSKSQSEDIIDEEILDEDTMVIDPELLEAVKEAVVEEKAEEIIDENDDNLLLPDNFKVDDIPFFKIYLASTEKGKATPRSVEYVPDIVYTYEKKDMMLYTVGYYKTSAEAQADLARYKDKGFYNARIIAIYKTIVVSQRMGDQILEKVNK